ncbi:MAG: hypothetical protein U5R06_17215 [candidate division KSB1 bacterium]|nr:hypothetical protein [candidate division KSB1 bacterium]
MVRQSILAVLEFSGERKIQGDANLKPTESRRCAAERVDGPYSAMQERFRLHIKNRLSAFIYTQIIDVETELNSLYT